MNENTNQQDIPPEILQKIFKFLNWDELKICSEVCKQWAAVSRDITELRWKSLCKRDFPRVFEEAFYKSRLSWEDLYKSLKLWPYVKRSKTEINYTDLVQEDDYDEDEEDEEYYQRKKLYRTIRLRRLRSDRQNRIQILKDGIIGIKNEKCNSINYYDSETLDLLYHRDFNFEIDEYEENEDLIVLQSCLKVYIVTKVNRKNYFIGDVVQHEWGDISRFYLVGNQVFYITKDYTLCRSRLTYENGEPKIQSSVVAPIKLFPALNSIIAVAYINEEQVNILTLRGHIYSIINQELNHLCRVEKKFNERSEVVNILQQHGFSWSSPEVYKWICSHDIIDGDWVQITHLKNAVVQSYGNIVLIGTSRRVLHIYYNPYDRNGNLKLFNKTPTLKINLNEEVPLPYSDYHNDFPATERQIFQIEVMEILDGHRIILLYCQCLVTIDLRLQLKRPLEQN